MQAAQRQLIRQYKRVLAPLAATDRSLSAYDCPPLIIDNSIVTSQFKFNPTHLPAILEYIQVLEDRASRLLIAAELREQEALLRGNEDEAHRHARELFTYYGQKTKNTRDHYIHVKQQLQQWPRPEHPAAVRIKRELTIAMRRPIKTTPPPSAAVPLDEWLFDVTYKASNIQEILEYQLLQPDISRIFRSHPLVCSHASQHKAWLITLFTVYSLPHIPGFVAAHHDDVSMQFHTLHNNIAATQQLITQFITDFIEQVPQYTARAKAHITMLYQQYPWARALFRAAHKAPPVYMCHYVLCWLLAYGQDPVYVDQQLMLYLNSDELRQHRNVYSLMSRTGANVETFYYALNGIAVEKYLHYPHPPMKALILDLSLVPIWDDLTADIDEVEQEFMATANYIKLLCLLTNARYSYKPLLCLYLWNKLMNYRGWTYDNTTWLQNIVEEGQVPLLSWVQTILYYAEEYST